MSVITAILMGVSGSIVVFTGLLPVVQDDEHLAAVLGHGALNTLTPE